MDQNSNFKKIILVLIVVVVVIFGFIFVLSSRDNEQADKPQPTEVDVPGQLVIDNTDKLREVLLYSQYSKLISELTAYISEKVDQGADHAFIVGDVVIEKNGNLNFKVHVDGADKEFEVFVDRQNFDRIILLIPSSNYKKDIKIYGG